MNHVGRAPLPAERRKAQHIIRTGPIVPLRRTSDSVFDN
jgi:hypothetical protein